MNPTAFIFQQAGAVSILYVGINSCQSRLAIVVILVKETLPAPSLTEEVLTVGATRLSSECYARERDAGVIMNFEK